MLLDSKLGLIFVFCFWQRQCTPQKKLLKDRQVRWCINYYGLLTLERILNLIRHHIRQLESYYVHVQKIFKKSNRANKFLLICKIFFVMKLGEQYSPIKKPNKQWTNNIASYLHHLQRRTKDLTMSLSFAI